MMEKGHLHITVDKELLEAARKKRRETGRSISHVVQEALRRWVEGDPPKEPPNSQKSVAPRRC